MKSPPSTKVCFETTHIEDKKEPDQQQRRQQKQQQPPQQQLQSRQLLSKYQSLFQQLLSKYLRFISSPARQDVILKTVQYTLWLLSRFYQTRRRQVDGGTSSTAKSLALLSFEISWTRYVLRFFGLPASIDGASTGQWGMTGIKAIDDDNDVNNISANASNKNKQGFCLWSFLDCVVTSKRIGKMLAWTMIGYFPLEHAAYLQWKAPNLWWNFGSGRRRRIIGGAEDNRSSGSTDVCPASLQVNYASKLSAWSCRFWLAFLVLDTVKSARALHKIRQLKQRKQQELLVKAVDANDTNYPNGADEGDVDTTSGTLPSLDELEVAAIGQKLSMTRSLLYLLPALNWSLPKWDTQPWLSEDVVNGLCWVEAVVGLYQSTRSY
jgi:hypothetical protein